MQHAAYLDGYLGGSDGRPSPNSLWYGSIDEPELRVFGSSVVYTPHRSKKAQMDPTGVKGYLVGYPPHMDGILVYDPSKSVLPVRATRNYQHKSWNEEIAVISEPIGVSADTYELLEDEIAQLEKPHMRVDHEAIPMEEANVPAEVKAHWQEMQSYARSRRRQLQDRGANAQETQRIIRHEWTLKQRAECMRKAQQRLTAENIEMLQQNLFADPNKRHKPNNTMSDVGTKDTCKSVAEAVLQRKQRTTSDTQCVSDSVPHQEEWDKTKERCTSCNGWEADQSYKLMLQCDKCDTFWHKNCLGINKVEMDRDWYCHRCWQPQMMVDIHNAIKKRWEVATIVDVSEHHICELLFDNGHVKHTSLHDVRWRPHIVENSLFVGALGIPAILDSQDAADKMRAEGRLEGSIPSLSEVVKSTNPYIPAPCPQTYRQYAKLDPAEKLKWEISMDKEWCYIVDNQVLSIVDRNTLPKGAVVIPCKCIYKIKSCGRYKSRMVCLGNLMPTEADDCSSPTPRLSSARMLFSMAAKADLDIHLCDVNTAFLAAQSPVPVYIQLPPGYEQPGKVGLCLRSLYGTSTAPKAFNTLLHNKMVEWGFEPNPHEACLYTRPFNGTQIHVLCHVDDLAIASTPEGIKWLKDTIRTTFMIDDQGPVKRYLGVDISREKDGYTWSQSRLIAELVKAAGHTVTKNY